MTTFEHNNLFSSKEEYLAFVSRWKELARAKKLTACDCLLRCMLLKQEVGKVMPVTSNATRLANGAAYDSGRAHAARQLHGCDALRREERRLAQVAQHTLAGRPVPQHLQEPGWEATWVDLLSPASYARGLTVELLQSAALLGGQAAE